MKTITKVCVVILCVFVGIVMGGLIGLMLVMPDSITSSQGAPSHNSPDLAPISYWLIIEYAVLTVIVGWYTRCRIAPWHGAEHMAIAAYERTGLTDIQTIQQESPVHNKCGGRLFLPIIAGAVIANLVSERFGVSELLVSLVILESMLWADTLWGLDKVPGISHASHLLQRWITTRMPGKQELLTAQRSLHGLVAAHNRL